MYDEVNDVDGMEVIIIENSSIFTSKTEMDYSFVSNDVMSDRRRSWNMSLPTLTSTNDQDYSCISLNTSYYIARAYDIKGSYTI